MSIASGLYLIVLSGKVSLVLHKKHFTKATLSTNLMLKEYVAHLGHK